MAVVAERDCPSPGPAGPVSRGEVKYLVLADRVAPYLLARVRWLMPQRRSQSVALTGSMTWACSICPTTRAQ